MARKTNADAALIEEMAETSTIRKDRGFLWLWLVLSTMASLAGNVGHAYLSTAADSPTRWMAISWAGVPPMLLMLAIEGLPTLTRLLRRDGDDTILKGVVWGVTGAAFVWSATGLYAFTTAMGVDPRLAWIAPVAVDLSVFGATRGLVKTAPIAARLRARIAHDARVASDEEARRLSNWERAVKTRPTATEVANAKADTAAMRQQIAAPTPAPTPPRAALTSPNEGARHTRATEERAEFAPVSAIEPSAEHMRLAHELVELRATSADVGAVAMALAMEENGSSRADTERATGIKKDALRRLTRRADELRDGAESPRESLHAVI